MERLKKYIYKHTDEKELQKFYLQIKEEERKKKTEELDIQKYAVAVLPIRYQIVSGKDKVKSQWANALTRNMSVAGLCARVEDMDVDGLHMVFNENPLNRNTVNVEICLPKQKPINIIGEVRWFERLTGEGKYNYNVGIKFLKISDSDIDNIIEFIKDKPDDRSENVRRW